MKRALLFAVAGLACLAAVIGPAQAQRPAVGMGNLSAQRLARLRRIELPYYILHTDLSDAEVRETDLRTTRMFEEYQRVTAGFAQKVDRKFDFFLFRERADYVAAGGPAKSAGVYMSLGTDRKLMSFTEGSADDSTWETIQHEGFHQFIHATMKAELPPWINEGLAEYFGQGVWTGDGFITGLIPPSRLRAVRQGIQGQFKPFRQLMDLNDATWLEQLNTTNYDEAWAMTHFLAHADNGKYVAPFGAFMNQVARGTDAKQAWEKVFGKDIDGFQRQFANWWMSLPDNPTQLGYTQALVQTETSFLARATLQRMQFANAEAFFRNFDPQKMAPTRDLWLPPAMWERYHEMAMESAEGWTLENGAAPKLSVTLADGTKLTGMFALGNGKVQRVGVQITPGQNARPAPGR